MRPTPAGPAPTASGGDTPDEGLCFHSQLAAGMGLAPERDKSLTRSLGLCPQTSLSHPWLPLWLLLLRPLLCLPPLLFPD